MRTCRFRFLFSLTYWGLLLVGALFFSPTISTSHRNAVHISALSALCCLSPGTGRHAQVLCLLGGALYCFDGYIPLPLFLVACTASQDSPSLLFLLPPPFFF